MGLFKKIKKNVYKARQYKLICRDNQIEIPKNTRINLDVFGKNNTVIVKSRNITKSGNITISIYGDDNTVVIGEDVRVSQYLLIAIGQNHKNFGPVKNCGVTIGRNTSFESCDMIIKNSNANIAIGQECMFAFNITLYHTDSHPVFDLNTKQIVNNVKCMNIGNHVWVGANTTILKNTSIADDCIIGWGSVVSGHFADEHCAIAGNPARKIKSGITWDSNGAKHGYIQNG